MTKITTAFVIASMVFDNLKLRDELIKNIKTIKGVMPLAIICYQIKLLTQIKLSLTQSHIVQIT